MNSNPAGSTLQPASNSSFCSAESLPALLWLDEPDYYELLKRGSPGALHPSWRVYWIWIEERIAMSASIGTQLKVYGGTALSVIAFAFRAKWELNTAALTACALDQMQRNVRPLNGS